MVTPKGEHWKRFDYEARRRLHEKLDGMVDDPGTNQEKEQEIACYFLERAGLGRLLDAGELGRSVDLRIVLGLLQWGGKSALMDRRRQGTGIIVDRETGQRLDAPQRGSIEVLDDDGAETGETQIGLWWEWSWQEFDKWVTKQLRYYASMRLKTRAMRMVQRLHEQFPESQTPGEACRLAGIDPRMLEIA